MGRKINEQQQLHHLHVCWLTLSCRPPLSLSSAPSLVLILSLSLTYLRQTLSLASRDARSPPFLLRLLPPFASDARAREQEEEARDGE